MTAAPQASPAPIGAVVPPAAAASGERTTVLLQALAALLIANSHLEAFYPLRWMAADGLLGNSMFFLLSGYGLMRSEQQHARPFAQYYARRTLRIYPALWLVVLVFELLVGGAWRSWTLADYGRFLLYPTHFGYVENIMIFYVPFFFLARRRQPRWFLLLATALVLPYAWFWWQDLQRSQTERLLLGTLNPWMWKVFFFQVMLLGGWLGAVDATRVLPRWKNATWLLLAGFAAYLAFKLAMVKGVRTPVGLLFNFYFILHALTAAILLLAFRVGTDSQLLAALRQRSALHWLIALVGGLTLEIYLVHGYIQARPAISSLMFPLNVAAFFVVTVAAAWFVAEIVKRLLKVEVKHVQTRSA